MSILCVCRTKTTSELHAPKEENFAFGLVGKNLYSCFNIKCEKRLYQFPSVRIVWQIIDEWTTMKWLIHTAWDRDWELKQWVYLYILCKTVHIVLGQGMGACGFATHFTQDPVPGKVFWYYFPVPCTAPCSCSMNDPPHSSSLSIFRSLSCVNPLISPVLVSVIRHVMIHLFCGGWKEKARWMARLPSCHADTVTEPIRKRQLYEAQIHFWVNRLLV